ncbi:hypothetical protein LY78DRAFT_621737 [Colletotrichum sublineola]|nr:hypothetical protein LY78DRAFT_621737 [Colletotrichum sublineola]
MDFKAVKETAVGKHRILRIATSTGEDGNFLHHNSSSLEELFKSVSDLDRKQASASVSRKVSSRLEPFIGFIERYSKSIDFFVQATEGSMLNPIALVWGLLRVVLVAASSLARYFPKLLDMFEQISQRFHIYHKYEEIFGQDESFKAALDKFYSFVFQFLLKARRVFQRRGRLLLIRSLWATFESDFHDTLDDMGRLLNTLEQETTFLHRKVVHTALETIHEREARHLVALNSGEIEKTRREIMDWLQPEDMDNHLHRVGLRRAPGTGDWIFDNDQFRRWDSTTGPGTLRILGDPGVGKTVIAGGIIHHLKEKSAVEQTAFSFYFFNKMNAPDVDEMGIWATMLAQICSQMTTIPSALAEAYGAARAYGRRRISFSDSPHELLDSIVQGLDRYYYVLDGIDEISSPGPLLSLIKRWSIERPHVRGIVVGQNLPQIWNGMEDWATLTLDTIRMGPDIQQFISYATTSLPAIGLEVRQTIINSIAETSGASFLWASLVIDSLKQALSTEHLLALLQHLPQRLTDIYVEHIKVLSAKDVVSRKLAASLLKWVCFSKRSLTWAELQSALEMQEQARGRSSLNASPTKLFKTAIIQLCHPLVLYDDHDDVFRLQHLSVREFLTSFNFKRLSELEKTYAAEFFFDERKAAHDLASSCLSHMMTIGHDKTPLGTYAASFWCEHVLEAERSSSLEDHVRRFLMATPLRENWLRTKLFSKKTGFSMQRVAHLQAKLNTWILDPSAFVDRCHSTFSSVPDIWIDDIFSILLAETTHDQGSFANGPTYFEKLMIVRDLARLLKQSNRVDSIVEKLERQLYIYRESSIRIKDVWILNALGLLYDQENDTKRSLDLHQLALKHQTQALGPNSMQSSWSINEIGRVYRHIGDFENSIAHHQRALQILRDSLPADHLEIAWTEATLARALRRKGRLDEALLLHQRAYRIRCLVLGKEHPHSLWILGDIAQCFRDQAKLEEAEHYHRMAFEGRLKTLGPRHPDTLWSMNDLGVVLAERGDPAGALMVQEEALKLQMQVLGQNHAHTNWTRETILEMKQNNSSERHRY